MFFLIKFTGKIYLKLTSNENLVKFLSKFNSCPWITAGEKQTLHILMVMPFHYIYFLLFFLAVWFPSLCC